MKNFLSRIVLLFFLINSTLLFNAGLAVAQNVASDTLNKSSVICFISDTQEPMVVERIIHKYNNNSTAREMLFDKILQISPEAVFHLGDIVAAGTKKSAWKVIDNFTGELKSKGIQFYPIPGNHEYLMSAKSGIKNFTVRYPYAVKTGYLEKVQNTAVILLNSNFKKLTDAEFRRQLTWYKETLKDLESDESVDFIIVGCHHSPFTNSKAITPSEDVQKYFLPDFYSTAKCRLFISGHAHAFEHFKMKGKDFLVIGGGGGIQQKLLAGKKERYKDLFDDKSEKRMFHFIKLDINGNEITVTLEMLNKDMTGIDSSYIINIRK